MTLLRRPGLAPAHPIARIVVTTGLTGALAVACGGGAAAPKSAEPPAQTTNALPNDVDGTLGALDRAETDLSRALGGQPPAAPTTGAEKERVDAAHPAEEQTAPHDKDASTLGEGSAGGGCGSACRALDSMKRAAEHLCGLTGEPDPRCDTARGRVARADERVRATCRAC